MINAGGEKEVMIQEMLRLQSLNVEIDAIKSDAQVFPHRLAEIQKLYDLKKRKFDEAKTRIQALKAELGDLNTTLGLEEQRLTKSKKKVNEITKSYEYQAMRKEIESTERSNIELTTQIKSKEQDIEKHQSDFTQIEQDFQKVESELLALKSEVDVKIGEVDGVLNEKLSEVKKLEADCDRQILSKYNLIRTRKYQDAIVAVINGACQGCFMKIPPQMANMMMRRKEYIDTCPNCQRLIFWMNKNKYTLFVDGASRGNPGQASIGCVLFGDDDEEVFSISEFLGIKTNNQAEYTAWIRGLEECLQKNISTLTVKSDSELIIRQLEGKYKVKNAELRLLYDEVKKLITRFESLEMKHVPRAQNSRADELANQALDQLNKS